MLARSLSRTLLRSNVARGSTRPLCTAPDTVTVTIAEAQAKTAQALRKIGWDEEDAGLQAEIMTAAEVCTATVEPARTACPCALIVSHRHIFPLSNAVVRQQPGTCQDVPAGAHGTCTGHLKTDH